MSTLVYDGTGAPIDTPRLGIDRVLTDRGGLVVWVLAIYLLAVSALQASIYWRYSTYWAYGMVPLFLMFLPVNRCWRIPELWLLLGLIVWMTVSALLSPWGRLTTGATWYVVKIYVVAIMMMMRCDSLPRLRLFLKMVLIGAAFVVVSGVIVGYHVVASGGERSMGLMTEENAYGWIASDGLLAGIVLLPMVGRMWRIFIYSYIGATILALLAAGSRSSATGAAVVILMYFLCEHLRYFAKNKKIFVPLALVLILVPVIVVKVYPDSPLVSRMLGTSENVAAAGRSDEFRINMYKHAWELFLQRPIIGHGPGTYRAYSRYVYTHSSVPELLFTVGPLGFLMYYGLVFILWRRLKKLSRWCRDDRTLRKVLNASRAVVVAVVIQSLFRVSHEGKLPNMTFALLIGFSARLLWAIKEDWRTGAYDVQPDGEEHEEMEDQAHAEPISAD